MCRIQISNSNIRDAKRDLEDHFERWYTSDRADRAEQPNPSAPRGLKHEKTLEGLTLQQQQQPDTLLKELDRYYKAKLKVTDDPIRW
ncbi:unnamed protein product [Clonostachys rosea f. rosea IK726]|uniref:Uncharacterized protein n=1 Tax=Clonostachys rosea f. rosea IK726 TaxID=1349383 RepID=A0ACA9UE70_BIOOC|nr:unnamed protein product [Clonostachys rosea f. rosea IK726]